MLSYPMLSYPMLSYPVLPYPILFPCHLPITSIPIPIFTFSAIINGVSSGSAGRGFEAAATMGPSTGRHLDPLSTSFDLGSFNESMRAESCVELRLSVDRVITAVTHYFTLFSFFYLVNYYLLSMVSFALH